MTGQPEGPPNLTGASIGDIAAGLFGAINILSRLHARDCSNLELPASSIDMSMTDCQMALLENAMARTRNTDTPVGPIGTRHAASAPFQLFNTIDAPLVIAVASDDIWKRFCCMLGKFGNTLFNDARFQSVNSRNKNVDALSDNLEKYLSPGRVMRGYLIYKPPTYRPRPSIQSPRRFPALTLLRAIWLKRSPLNRGHNLI